MRPGQGCQPGGDATVGGLVLEGRTLDGSVKQVNDGWGTCEWGWWQQQ